MLDVVISNGWIIDGTGNPAYSGNVGVKGDELFIYRGEDVPDANRIIDATGSIISPGFIDLHSHAALTILGHPNHDAKVRQGVTTELVGVDGISHAPFKAREELERYIWLDSGLNGYPPQPVDWLTVGELLDKYDNAVAINMAFIVGNSPIRIWAVGWDDKPATRKQQLEMEAITREAMASGAWGISTGLDYPPGAYATTDELVGIVRTAAQNGGFYHTHVRNSLRSEGPLRPWEEALEIGRRSESAVHLTHFYQPRVATIGYWEYLGLVETARAEGMDVTFDVFSYALSNTTPTIVLPAWAKAGGPERLLKALTNDEERSEIREQLLQSVDPWGWETGWYTNFLQPENAVYDGLSITEIASIRGQQPVDAFLDLMVDENLGMSWVGATPSDKTLAQFIAHPSGMIASDALLVGEHPNPRSYGCFPQVLGEYVRKERVLTLEDAIRKMTSFPAQRLGLADRGLLRDRMKADIVVFNPDTVEALSEKGNLRAFPKGIDFVIVNGTIVIENGVNSGALPGMALRKGIH